jgi:hypothetical protein
MCSYRNEIFAVYTDLKQRINRNATQNATAMVCIVSTTGLIHQTDIKCQICAENKIAMIVSISGVRAAC